MINLLFIHTFLKYQINLELQKSFKFIKNINVAYVHVLFEKSE
jgi:hypothetical protein